MIREDYFIKTYRETWTALEHSIHGNPLDTVDLYRQVSSHLSYARTYYPDHEVTRYLNALVSRAHLVLYGKRKRDMLAFSRFFTQDIPDAFYRCFPFFLLSYAITIFGIVIGILVVNASPSAITLLLPSSLISGIHPLQTGPHVVNAPIMASEIMSNNIRVAVISFLGFFSAGIYTIYSMYINGMLLGSIVPLFLHVHRFAMFSSLILPHGVTEITAISLSGGCSLMAVYRFFVPQKRKRLASLKMALFDGIKLIVIVTIMLVIAGTIESFITPGFLAMWIKFAIAGGTFVFWVAYFSYCIVSAKRRSRAT